MRWERYTSAVAYTPFFSRIPLHVSPSTPLPSNHRDLSAIAISTYRAKQPFHLVSSAKPNQADF